MGRVSQVCLEERQASSSLATLLDSMVQVLGINRSSLLRPSPIELDNDRNAVNPPCAFLGLLSSNYWDRSVLYKSNAF